MLAYLDKKEKGFTLMELLIAVAIVAVLAGVGIPVYLGLQNRAKAAEATANLDGIGLSQEAYKLTNDTYINCLASPRVVADIDQDPFPWGDLDTGFTTIGFDTNKSVRFSYAVAADATNPHLEYYAGAIGDTDGDGDRILYISSQVLGPHEAAGDATTPNDDDTAATDLSGANAFNAVVSATADIAD